MSTRLAHVDRQGSDVLWLPRIAAVAALGGCLLGEAAARSPESPLPLKTHRSASGHFEFVGTNAVENMLLGQWAELVAERTGQLLSVPLPFDGRRVRLVVQAGDTDDCGVHAPSELYSDGLRIQRLVMPAIECLDDERVLNALCRLLLSGYVATAADRGVPRTGAQPLFGRIPPWLAQGVARNLTAEWRAVNSRHVVARWQEGRLPLLKDWLARAAEAPGENRYLYGVFVDWLLDCRDRPARTRALFRHIAGGGAVTADWLVALLPGANSAADLEELWDSSMLVRKRVVFRPGTIPAEAVRQLRAALLLYPGDSGIPLASSVEQGSGLGTLLEHRGARWVPVFCRAKVGALQLMAAGRGPAFHEVVDRYTAFLNALAAGKGRRQLSRLLEEAEAAHAELETKYGGR